MSTGALRIRGVLAALLVVVSLLVGASVSGAAPMKPAKAKAEIGHAYDTLFNFSNHRVSAKTAVIQDGGTLRKALSEALASSLAKKATGATVVSVQLLAATQCRNDALPSPCAKVTYNLLGADKAPLFATPAAGYAVYLGGRWLVAKSTICGLLALFYSASGRRGSPPNC